MMTKAGKNVTVDVGYERFLAPEMFFHPEFMSKDFKKPLEALVDEAIQSCPIDYRQKLYNNIVLSGGSTLFTGFDKRLNKNLQGIIDKRMAKFDELRGDGVKTEMPCNVGQNLVQKYAVWFGGSMLGSMDNFKYTCKSREDYAEHGPSICRHNPIFG